MGLTSLEGSPKSVTGNFVCSFNPLKSLQHAPKIIDNILDLRGTKITSLDDIHKHVQRACLIFLLSGVRSGWLSLFLIKNLRGIYFDDTTDEISEVVTTINSFLKGGVEDKRKFLLPCQQALIKAGFTEYAKIPTLTTEGHGM